MDTDWAVHVVEAGAGAVMDVGRLLGGSSSVNVGSGVRGEDGEEVVGCSLVVTDGPNCDDLLVLGFD